MTTPADLFPPDFPPRIPLPPIPPAPAGRLPLALSEILSWAVILLIVAFIFIRPFLTRAGAAAHANVEAESSPSLPTLLTARTLVGLNSFYPLKPAHLDESELASLDALAKTPSDKLRAAIVRGEIQNLPAAGKILDRLAADDPKLLPDIATLDQMYAGELSPDSPEWQSFRSRHAWFADLAASHDKPSTDPLREKTLRAAFRTLAVTFFTELLAAALGLVGAVLLIIAIVLYFKKRIRPAFNRQPVLPADRRAYVQAFALYLAIYALAGLALREILRALPNLPESMLWSMIPLLLAFTVGLLWPLLRGQSRRQWQATLGLHTGKGFFREILCGILGYIAGLPILFVGFIVTLFLIKISGLDASHPITREFTGKPANTLLLFLLASVWAPITEELMFRGALFAHLRQRFGFWLSAIPLSILFAAIHPQGWPVIPLLASIALVLAALREYRGSIIASMTAHSLTNTVTLLLMILSLS